MVLRRSDSKSSKDVHDPLDQNPKRTKVHAQRKFAQGSGMNSPMVTPIKDKDMVKINGNSSPQDFLPTKRPRTEDFLTFLCFRGTKALPSRLDFFNNATKFEKTEKDTSSPGTTDQAPSNSASTSEKSKTKPNMKNKVGRPVFNKIKEKLLAHKDRIRRTAQKGKSVLRSRALIEDRQKKATGKGSKKSLNRNTHRGTHPSILKRLGAARMRSGLRSSGQLPPGSDAGIKSDRKPRQIAKPRGKSTEAKGKSSLKKSVPETESSESELEKDENQDEEEEVIKDKSKKSVRISTRSRQKPARIQSKSNVKARPTRKTKEAAALYMEMLTKDLRNNEEDEEVGEDDDFEEDFDYLVQKTPSKQEAKIQKTVDQEKVKPSLKNTKKPLINRTKHVHPSILKRLGAARMRSGLRSSGQLPAGSDVGIKSDRKPRQILKRKMKPIIKGKLMRKKRKTESLSSETEQDEDEDESSKKSSRTSSQTRQNTAKNPPKSLNVHTRPSRKTKEAATLYMEMLKKDLRSPDEEEFEDEMFPEDTSSQVDETEEKVKSNKSNTKQQESKALVNKKIVLPSYGKKRVAVLRSQRILQKSRMAAKLALKRRVSSRRLRAKRSTVSELEKPSSNEEEEDDDDEVSGKSSESEAENKVKSPKRTRQISESEKVVSDSNKRGATKTTPAETSLKPSSSSPKKTVGRKAKVPKDEEESENESDNSEKETSIVNTSDKVKPVGKKAKVSTKQPDSDEEDSGVDSNKQKAADTKLKPATSSQKKSIGTKPQPSKDGQDSEDESDNLEKGETKSTAADKSKPVGKKAKVQKKQPESGSDDSEKESNMAAGKSPAQKKSLRKKGKPSVGKKESESETDDDGKGKNKSNDTEKPIAQKKLFRKKTKPPVIEQSESESDEEIDGKGLHNTPVAKLLKSGPPQQRKSLGKKGKGPVGSKDSESEIDDSEKKINKSSTEDKPRSKPGRKPSVKKINTPMHESDSEVESDDSEIETTKVSTRKSAKSEPKFPKKPIRRKTNATEDGRKSEIEPEMQTNKTNTRSSSKFELPSSKKPSSKKGQTADEKENEDTSDESEEEVSKTTRKSLKSESASQKNTALKKTKPPVDDKVSERESDDSETKETKKSSKPEPSAENKTEGGRVKPPIIGKETESESNEPEKMPNNKKSLKTEPELQQKPVEKKAKMSVDVKDNEIELEDVEMAVKISATSKMKKSVKPELPQKKTVDNKTKTATVVTIDNKTKVTTVDNKTKVAKDENEMNDSGTEPSEIVPAKTKKAIKSEIPQPKKTAVKKPVDKKQSENESDDSDLDEKEEQKDRAKQLSEPLINKGSETESKKLDNKNTTQIAKTKIETKSSPLTTRKSSVKKIENDTKIILPDDEPKNKNNSEESKKLNLESETKLVPSVQSEEDKPKKIETQSFEETTIRRQKPSLTAEAKVLKLEPPSPKKSPRSKSKFLLDDDEFDESEQEESEEEVIVAKAKTKGRKPNKINQQTKELASKKNYHPNYSAIQPTFAEKIETAKKEKPSDEFGDSEVEEIEEEDIVANAKIKGRKPNKINQQTKELASKKNYHPNNSAIQPTFAEKIETAMKERPSDEFDDSKLEESEEEDIVAKAKTKGRKPNKINQQTKELASKKNYHPNTSAIQPTFAEKIETAKKEKPSDEFSDSEVEESEEEDIVAKAKTKGRKPNKINQQTKELASKKNYHPNNSATQPTVAQKIETAMKEKPSEKVNEEKSNKQVDSLEEMKGKSTRKSVKSLQDEILKNPSVNIKRTSNVPFGLKKCDPNMINNNITSKERSEKEIDSMSMPKQIKTEMKHEDSPKKSKELQGNFPFSEDIKTAFGFDENFDSKEKKLAEHLFQVKKEEPTLVIAGKVKDESRQNVPDKSSEKAGRKGNRLSPDEGKVKAGQKSAQSQKLLTKTQQKKANTSKCEKEKHLGKTSDSVGLQNSSNKQQMARGLTSKQEADKVKPTSNAGEKLLKIEQKLGLATPVNSRKSLEKKANVEEITFHQKIEPEIPIANTTNQNIADENNRQNVEFLSTISKQSVESDVAEFLVALQDGQILFNKGNQNFNANNIGQLQLMQTTVTEFVPTEKQETRPRRRSFLRNESNENSIKQIEDVKNVSKKGSNSRKCSTDSLSSVECKVILEPIEGFELPKRTDVDRLKEKLDMTWSNSQKPKTSNLEVGLKQEEIVQTLNVDKHNLAHKSFKENEIAQFNAASGQSFKFHNKSGDGFGITTQNQGMSMESCGIDAFKGQFGMKRNEGKVLPSISEAFKFQNKVDPYFHIKQNELGLMKPMSLESPKPLKTYEDDAKRFDISRTKPPDLTIPALQFKPSEERAFAFCERGKSSNIEPSPSRKQNDIGKQLTKVVETVKEEDKKPVKKKRDVGSVLEEMCKKQAMKKSESVNFTSVDPAALLAQKVISGPPDSSQKNVLALDQQKWMGKFSTQPDKLPTDLSIKTSAESKKMAKLMESAITDNKTLPGELYIETSNTILFPENKLTYEGNDVKSENDKQISLEKLNQQAHLSRSTTSASSESDSFKNLLISEKDMPSKSDNEKSKNSMSETWRQAFKNAKIPKPGQRSPAPHSVEPFVRRPFFKSEVETKKPQTQMTKLPNIQSFKNFQKFGSNSPSRAFTPETYEGRGHVYLSPKRNESHKDSPSKSSVSSSEELKFEPKKIETLPTKSLTQLQYEKRSSELISSLKESPPLVLDKESTIFKQNFSKLKETKSEAAKPQQPQPQPQKPTEGKHLNLPLAVEHTLRKMSPTTVSKKQNPAKTIIAVEKKVTPQTTPSPVKKPETPAEITPAVAVVNKPSASEPPPQQCSSGNMEMLVKKKVNMSTDEINRWLNDTSSSKIEHAKGCGIFQNNQCECSFRTSSASMQNSVGVNYLLPKEESKVDHGVVEPPIQLKELDSTSKFVAETISTCKVADYREKLMSKKPKPLKIENTKDVPLNFSSKSPKGTSSDKSFKSNRSMTEEEMCEYGFRFERNLNSPRESSSEMSSPTHKEEPVTFDKPETPTTERKAIFHQRRTGNVTKRPSLSKSPSAFSAENESSVYAFEPDLPPPTLNKPFRRRGSRVKSSDEETPSSLSIAVQVNLENEAVLECSTQTEQVGTNETRVSCFIFRWKEKNPGNEQVIQGVAVKLQSTDGPDQKVLMSAELVTKPSPTFPRPTTSRSLGEVPTRAHKPEQKVRPLSSISTSTSTKPLVGTVQPTIREPVVSKDQGTLTKHEKSQQATAPLPKPPKEKEDKEQKDHKDDYPPTRGKGKTRYSSSSSSVSHNEFPIPGTPACLVEAPVYYPTEKEFQDPLEYIEQITPSAQSFGICRIVPPANFKPECKVSDDMRFTAYNQYVHKMLNRWGPNVREMSAIKKYLATQSITFNQLPLIGGMEVDLPRLYQTVQSCGGLKEVIEKKRWTKVADMMKIPKSAQDRVTKLDDIYCKYLLPYDTLSHAERSKLLNEVEIEWKARERRILEEKEEEKEQHDEDKEDESDSESDSDERDECITKGKSMALNAFYRIARNTMAMWFKETNPSAKDVEAEYWKHVSTGMCHLCVHSGSIDSGTWGYGFPTAKSSSTSRHPWNLKVLTNNNGSILRSLGPIMGVTVPTLHVGMLFTACCWYRDPLSLPWIEYLHTGASKIWYGVPDSWCEELRGAVKNLLPRFCRDKKIWLASDTAMVPPELLVQQGVSLCRTVQEPGQFVLVFPKAFTSTICTGYLVSESVYFAQPSWLNTAKLIFKDIQESCEPPIFSLEKLLFNIASDIRSPVDVLMQVLPMIVELKETEVVLRKELEDLGIPETETLIVTKGRKSKASQDEIIEYECEICRGNLFLSLVTNMQAEINYCLPHAIDIIKKDSSVLKHCKLMHAFDEEEMDELIEKIKTRIETKSQKKSGKGGGSKS